MGKIYRVKATTCVSRPQYLILNAKNAYRPGSVDTQAFTPQSDIFTVEHTRIMSISDTRHGSEPSIQHLDVGHRPVSSGLS